MILRIWHGTTDAARADAYDAFLAERALPDYRATPGNVSATVMRHTDGAVAHFYTLSLWRSMDAIRAFAGDDVERARYYPEDRDFLTTFEPTVRHVDVAP